MYTIEQYNKANLDLARSINIKLHSVGLLINKRLKQYGYDVSTNPKEWKYYLNLSGLKHCTNSDVKINVLETMQEMSLTKELLQEYTSTKYELEKLGVYYNNLIQNYPNDIDYIRGCIFPNELDYIITCKDGTIINYNKQLIEPYEYNLIPRIQEYIYHYLARWYIKEYTIIEELYIPSLLATLFANLPLVINNIRIDNINTNYVHSFHLEHFFKSYLDISDTNFLPRKLLYWLYINLPDMVRKVGTNNVFNKLKRIINYFDFNITTIDVVSVNPTLKDNNQPKCASEAKLRELNQPVYITNDKLLSSDNDLLDINDFYKQYYNSSFTPLKIRKEIDYINTFNFYTERTKYINLTKSSSLMILNNDIIDLVFNHFIYGAKHKLITFLIDYKDTYTGKNYVLSNYTSILVLIKSILYIANCLEKTVSSITYRDIFAIKYDLTEYSSYIPVYILKELSVNYDPFKTLLVNVSIFREFILKRNNFNHILSLFCSIYKDSKLKQLVTQYYNNLVENGVYELSDTPVTIDTLLTRSGVSIEFSSKEHAIDTFCNIIQEYTGLYVKSFNKNLVNALLNFINKLTSYTVNINLNRKTVNKISLNISNYSITHFNSNALIQDIQYDFFGKPLYNLYVQGEYNNFTDTYLTLYYNRLSILFKPYYTPISRFNILYRTNVTDYTNIYDWLANMELNYKCLIYYHKTSILYKSFFIDDMKTITIPHYARTTNYFLKSSSNLLYNTNIKDYYTTITETPTLSYLCKIGQGESSIVYSRNLQFSDNIGMLYNYTQPIQNITNILLDISSVSDIYSVSYKDVILVNTIEQPVIQNPLYTRNSSINLLYRNNFTTLYNSTMTRCSIRYTTISNIVKRPILKLVCNTRFKDIVVHNTYPDNQFTYNITQNDYPTIGLECTNAIDVYKSTTGVLDTSCTTPPVIKSESRVLSNYRHYDNIGHIVLPNTPNIQITYE